MFFSHKPVTTDKQNAGNSFIPFCPKWSNGQLNTVDQFNVY